MYLAAMKFELIHIIHIAYITLALFSILLVLGRRPCKALILLLCVHLIEELFNIYEEMHVAENIYLITPALQLAYGPLYYLFAKNLIYGDISIRNHLIHLFPALIAIGFTHWWPIELMVAFALLMLYLTLTYRLLHRYHSVLKDAHSLKWLIRTLIVIGTLEFINFIRLNLQLTLSYELLNQWYLISALISLICTAYLVLKAVRHPQLYSGIADIQRRIETFQQKPLIPAQEDIEMAQTLFSAIVEHQRFSLAYRRPKYSLRNLADEMGLSEQNLSWSINTGGQQNFSDFINGLRIEDVKQSLQQITNDRNILNIAYEAGFNSKSSFNAVFKKHTRLTPSQYVKQISL
jgi:AraC-like DNA-binding protein